MRPAVLLCPRQPCRTSPRQSLVSCVFPPTKPCYSYEKDWEDTKSLFLQELIAYPTTRYLSFFVSRDSLLPQTRPYFLSGPRIPLFFFPFLERSSHHVKRLFFSRLPPPLEIVLLRRGCSFSQFKLIYCFLFFPFAGSAIFPSQ